jgi:hypothetical protein
VRLRQPALRAALIALIGTRLFVWGIAIAGRLIWGRNDVNPQYFDLTQFTQPFGSKGVNLVAGVFAVSLAAVTVQFARWWFVG